VTQPASRPGRFFGILFMVPGLKLLWDFVSGILEVARAADWRLLDLLGFGVWLLMASVFLVPGWLLASFRRRVLIDRAQRTVLQINDFLVYRWSSTRSFDEFNTVRVYAPSRSSSKRARVSHHVELTCDRSKKALIVFIDDDYDRARAVGREVSTFTALRFRDDVEQGVDAESDEDAT
jgi:hypothetical protein